MHWNDPTDDRIPPEYQAKARAEKRAQRRETALAAARSAGRHDARGLSELAEQDWRDVTDIVGSPVPRIYVRERRRAAKEAS